MRRFPSPKSPTLQATIFITLSVFAAMLTLSIVMKVEVKAQGKGKFIPKERTQIVQSEFGGRINAINVTNGQNVKQGDVVIVLDDIAIRTELDTISFDITNLQFVRDRIILSLGILSTREITDGLAQDAISEFENLHQERKDDPSFRGQLGLLEAEANSLTSNIARMDAELAASDQARDLIQIELDQAQESWKIQQERFSVVEQLRKNGTATQTQYLETLEQLQRYASEIKMRQKELEQNRSQRTALERTKDSFIKEQINALSKEQNETLSELSTLHQRLIATQRELSASSVLAPVDGIVDQLGIHTIGGVVDAGQELMRIVPTGSDLIFESVFSNENVAFLETGLKAKLSIDAYPSERYGFLEGYLFKISADSVEIDEKTWGFSIQVVPDAPELMFQSEILEIKPGMTATADIITDKRRLISYFFAPIIDTLQNSLSER